MHLYSNRGENIVHEWIMKPRIGDVGLRRNSWRPGPMVGMAQGLARINTNLVLPWGKPRCMSYYFNLWIIIYAYYLCITFQELFETLVAWSLGFPRSYTNMNRSLAQLCLIGLDRSRVIILSLVRCRMSLYYITWVTLFKMEGMGWETGWENM